MKQCPACGLTYMDDSLSYCLDDGASLISVPAGDEPATAILGSQTGVNEAPTRLQITPPKTAAWSKRLGALVAVAILVVAGLVAYRYVWTRPAPHISSVAVMPFVNESGDPEIEYLSDGMTETLISSLSELPDLKVKARSSVFRYKGKDTDTKTIGAELGVQALLNGRLVKHGDELTLFLELVDPDTGDRTWGAKYSRPISELLSLQGDIARDVSQKLKTRLSDVDQERVTKSSTANVEAYQIYLRGRYNLFKLTPAGIQTGISYFQQAIDVDPNYALAYVGLATCYRALVLSNDMPSQDFFPKAKASAQRAVDIDDTLAEAHAVLGFTIFWYDWDWEASEREFKRALELNPNSADAHWGYGHLLSNTGRHPEALAEAKLARELDPLSLIIGTSEALYLIDAGRTDEGLARLQEVLELEPDYWFAHLHAASGHCDKGDYEGAISEARRAKELNSASTLPIAYMGYALARAGRKAEARATLDELLKPIPGRYVPPYHLALIYNGLDDREQTLAWLQRGITERDPKMTFLKVDRKWSNLAGDPRFQEILKLVGFD